MLSTRVGSNPRITSRANSTRKQSDTDYIDLNRRMTQFSRTMGKEATMGETSFRAHSNALNSSFPLTSLKEEHHTQPQRQSVPLTVKHKKNELADFDMRSPLEQNL